MESSSPSVFVNSSKEGIARVKVRISEEGNGIWGKNK